MSSSQPNILWITLDSVRADRTSLHNYSRDTTPGMSRIASKTNGVNFKHGISHSTRTPVSVPSMLTGLYPSRHRMIGTKSGDRLPDTMKTAPELLSEVGYQTIGVSENGYAGEVKGIDERFDTFIKSSPSTLSDFLSYDLGRSLVKYAFKTREHGPGLTRDHRQHGKQNSFFTTDIAKRKISSASHSDDPIFCYVHYDDPHHPYIPPLSTRNEYIGEIEGTADEAIAFAQEMHANMYEWMASGLPLSDDEWDLLFAMYDAAIKYTDRCVRTLFDFVQETLEDTIVIITADHGDLFGEYGLLGHHIVLHDGLTHVPLVTHGLDGIAHHANRPTQHNDVMKTVLSVAGAETSQFQGYDLRHQSRDVAISQDLRGTVDDPDVKNYDRIQQYNPDIDLSNLPKSQVTAVRTEDFKLVYTEEQLALYRLPDEHNDVKNEYHTVYVNLLSFVQEWLENEGAMFEDEPQPQELTKETKQHLQDMGYLES